MSIKWKAAVAGSVVGALALAGCGGSSGAADSASSLSLVGFSILEQANKQVIADSGKTAAGKGVTFKQSYGASGDQSRAVEAGQKADIVHLSLEPDVQRLVDAKLVSPTTGRDRDQGHPHPVRGRHRGPQGQPQGHQDLGRPGQAGCQDRHPEPGLVGLREVEHPRGVRPRAGQRRHRRRGAGVPEEVLRQRRRPPGQRPGRDHRVQGRHRRRAAVLRERGDPGPAERRGLRLHRPRPGPC